MRVEGWESLLYVHLLNAREPFVWGDHDCVLWSADWAGQATGRDLSAPYRDAYDSEESATTLLSTLGFTSVADLASAHLADIPVKKAQRGDLLLHPKGMLGICDGAHAYFLTLAGVTRIPFTKCVRAWKVG